MPQSKLATDHATILREQTHRIHCAVNDGTLDKDTVNDALAKLTALADPAPNGGDPSDAPHAKAAAHDKHVDTRGKHA